MKLPITLRASRSGKRSSTSVSLRPDLLRALGLPPDKILCAVLDRRQVILCPPEEAEMWERVLEDFPRFFIGESDGEGRTRTALKGQPAGGSERRARSHEVRRARN